MDIYDALAALTLTLMIAVVADLLFGGHEGDRR